MESRDWSSDVCSSDLFPSHDNGGGYKMVDEEFVSGFRELAFNGYGLTVKAASEVACEVTVSLSLVFPISTPVAPPNAPLLLYCTCLFEPAGLPPPPPAVVSA